MPALSSFPFLLILVALASGLLPIGASAQLIPRENVVITPVGPTIKEGSLQYQDDFTVSLLPEGLAPDARLTDFTIQATRFVPTWTRRAGKCRQAGGCSWTTRPVGPFTRSSHRRTA
jgi:hypothetical protein